MLFGIVVLESVSLIIGFRNAVLEPSTAVLELSTVLPNLRNVVLETVSLLLVLFFVQ